MILPSLPAAHQQQLEVHGFTVIPDLFSAVEMDAITQAINQADHSQPTFRKTNDLFAIRQFLKALPVVQPLVLTTRLYALIEAVLGAGYFVVKSIYFDKPAQSNWFVAYHQDLTISVDKKLDLPGFGPWTVKHRQ